MAGRPRSIIDWDKIDELLIAGCSGAQAASSIGIDKQTIYERCVTDRGMTFAQYSQQKYENGEAQITLHQYRKALGLSSKGDNSLLLWLGKTRLKQKEHEDQVITQEVESKFEKLMNQLQVSRQSSSNKDSTIDDNIKTKE